MVLTILSSKNLHLGNAVVGKKDSWGGVRKETCKIHRYFYNDIILYIFYLLW